MRILSLILSLGLLCSCCDQKQLDSSIRELYSNETRTRGDAARYLARCGERAEKAVPRLGQMLYDPNVGVQSSAAYALRKIATPQAKQILQQAIAARDGNK